MIKLRKNFDTFEDTVKELESFSYSDDVFDFNPEGKKEPTFMSYDGMLDYLIRYVAENAPSVSNTSFPNCISVNISSYGFNYVKNNIGFGLSIRYNRKTGAVSYSLIFNFDRDEHFLNNNNFFNYLISEDYETVRRK